MKLLLLLTSMYPCGAGEDFLVDELPLLNGFTQIIVCPTNVKPGETLMRPLPKGISCAVLPRAEISHTAYARLAFSSVFLRELMGLAKTGRCVVSRAHSALFFLRNAKALMPALEALPQVLALKAGDEVCLYSYWFYDAACAAALLKKNLLRRGVKVKQVSRAHGFDLYPERSPLGCLPLREFLLGSADAVFPCSQNGTDALSAAYPYRAGKLRTAYLGVPDCGEHSGRQSAAHILTCSNFAPVKRLPLLVEALAACDFPLKWTHIGGGTGLEVIKDLAAQKLPPNISCSFTGQLTRAQLAEFYAGNEISAFVNVSSSEGIPVTVMEACSHGVPALCTAAGGTPEAVQDGKTGFLLPVDFTPVQFAKVLQTLLSLSQEEYAALCGGARSMWAQKFNSEKNYREFSEVLAK